jgi:hypothetical protein
MAFTFTKPLPGLKPADSITISLATGIGVAALYSGGVGPMADVSMTNPNDGNIASATKKAGWKAIALVAAVTVLTRDVNVVFIGGSMIILEHVMYLHANMTEPSTGQIAPDAGAYAPAGPTQLSAVS